jgi:hypothetical protein
MTYSHTYLGRERIADPGVAGNSELEERSRTYMIVRLVVDKDCDILDELLSVRAERLLAAKQTSKTPGAPVATSEVRDSVVVMTGSTPEGLDRAVELYTNGIEIDREDYAKGPYKTVNLLAHKANARRVLAAGGCLLAAEVQAENIGAFSREILDPLDHANQSL